MKKIYKKLLITIIMLYFVITLISQQKTLNTYKAAEENYQKQLETAQETNKDLVNTKANVSSSEFIEEVAR